MWCWCLGGDLGLLFQFCFFVFLFFFLRYAGLSLLWPLPLRSTGSGRAGSAAMAHGHRHGGWRPHPPGLTASWTPAAHSAHPGAAQEPGPD
uniref:Uncharacterized protein n=1 Tax=Phocoena sinus TaxID=42100 RepID=A0A8C9CAV6_PHOSS